MKIVIIGAGNLATHLSLALQKKGIEIIQIYSRTSEKACEMADTLNCPFTTQIVEINPNADLYIFSVKDNALSDVLTQMRDNNGLWVHTAGSIPMDVFKHYTKRYGVLYPLQTFSKNRDVNFQHIPFFIEAEHANDFSLLYDLASIISDKVIPATSEQRRYLHLAAVFANNFTNHMYAIASKILEDHDMPFDALLPIIEESAAKVRTLDPKQAQTGPAVRYDENVMAKHIEILNNDDFKDIYLLLSKSINHLAKE